MVNEHAHIYRLYGHLFKDLHSRTIGLMEDGNANYREAVIVIVIIFNFRYLNVLANLLS